MLLSSAYGFNRDDAKTSDHFFTGFPSYWNIVVFYLLVDAASPDVNAAILLAFAVLVFVPIRYLYPSRTAQWRPVTKGLGVVWGAADDRDAVAVPGRVAAAVLGLARFPVYYFVLSLMLHARAEAVREDTSVKPIPSTRTIPAR